jgi:response regulator RpfG family c-di-GMP phosphodiesterase
MLEQVKDVSILYVEDDDAIREYMLGYLGKRFNQVLVAENGAAGFETYRKNTPDIIMTDIRMPIMDGLEMIRAILTDNDAAAVIITSAYDDSNYLLGAIELGISHYLLKPFDTGKVDASLWHCIKNIRKKQSIRNQEKSIAAAYQTIDSLIDYGENSLNDAVNLDADTMERQLDRMVEGFFGERPGLAMHSPTSLIMTLTHGLPGQPEWFLYEMGDDRQLQKTSYPDHPPLDLGVSTGKHDLYYVNEGEPLPDDPLLKRFAGHFFQHRKQPRNLIWYRHGSRIICALDYPGMVTACDATVVKNLAVQTRYMDTISAQCHQTEEAFFYTITSLARAAETNDEDTGNHILRVGKYCAAICRHLGYSDEMAEIMALQSQLHDVGKIHIPAETLKKPGKLTDAEMELIRDHPLFGAKIIGTHPRLEIARTIAQYHHERWDGSGYPFGLCGTEIPLDARIVAIADTYDALRNKRSYKPAFDHDMAYRIIVEGDGRTEPTHFDPELLRIFKTNDKQFNDIYEQFATQGARFCHADMGILCR